MISGSDSTTGLHTSLDQDALLDIQAPTENNYMPNPQPPNELLNPLDTSDVSQEMLDILTDVEQQPDILEPDMSVDAITVETDPIVHDPVVPQEPVEPPEPVEHTDNDAAGDRGTKRTLKAGTDGKGSDRAKTEKNDQTTKPAT